MNVARYTLATWALLLAGCQNAAYQPHGSSQPPGNAPGSDRYAIAQDHAPATDRARALALPQPVPRAEVQSRYGNGPTYQVWGVTYEVLASAAGYREEGIASWYGAKFHGHRTSSGETYDMYQLSAAHKTLPIPGWARVTNLDNGKSTLVRVNDRGPFHPDRIIDLSWAAAVKLDIDQRGTGRVRVEAIDPAADRPGSVAAATNSPPPPAGQLFLQVGAFKQRSSASQLVAALSGQFDWPLAVRSEDSLYRVWIGPFANQATRLQARQALHDAGFTVAINIDRLEGAE